MEHGTDKEQQVVAATHTRRGRPSLSNEDKKKSTSFYLSDNTRADIKTLARAMRLSQASVIETLVLEAMKSRGLRE